MDGTYSIIASEDNGTLSAEEWILGAHTRGQRIVDESLVVISDTFQDSYRTVMVELPIIGSIYSFPSSASSIDIIVSDGLDNNVEYATATRMGAFESS